MTAEFVALHGPSAAVPGGVPVLFGDGHAPGRPGLRAAAAASSRARSGSTAPISQIRGAGEVRICRIADVTPRYIYAFSCMSLTVVVISNSALSFMAGACRLGASDAHAHSGMVPRRAANSGCRVRACGRPPWARWVWAGDGGADLPAGVCRHRKPVRQNPGSPEPDAVRGHSDVIGHRLSGRWDLLSQFLPG